jgi:hypothetical protein
VKETTGSGILCRSCGSQYQVQPWGLCVSCEATERGVDPLSTISVEQLQIAAIGRLLDEARVPKEVWIGTDSLADRVDWALRRLKVLEQENGKLAAMLGGENLLKLWEGDAA